MTYRNPSVSDRFYLLGCQGTGEISYVSLNPNNSTDVKKGTFKITTGETIIPLESEREGSIITTILNNTIKNYKI